MQRSSPLARLDALTVYRTDLGWACRSRPGASTLSCATWPDSVRWGLLVSGVTLALVAGWVTATLLRTRSGPRHDDPVRARRWPCCCQRWKRVFCLISRSCAATGVRLLLRHHARPASWSRDAGLAGAPSRGQLPAPARWLAQAGHSEMRAAPPQRLGGACWWRCWPGYCALRLAPMSGLLARPAPARLAPYAIWHADARMYCMSLALTTASTLCMAGWLAPSLALGSRLRAGDAPSRSTSTISPFVVIANTSSSWVRPSSTSATAGRCCRG
ncbi:MAG: hypothetical protein R2854_19210 [Caldilineaceae bacterium]